MTTTLPTTYLFVPGNDERRVPKALASAADAVILDLEDSVPEDQKALARSRVAQWTAEAVSGGPELWVRVNDATSGHLSEDLRAIDWQLVAGGILPKFEDSRAIRALAEAGARQIILLVETVRGLQALLDLAGTSYGVLRLAIGTWDLAIDLGLVTLADPDQSELIWHLRADLAVKSRALNLVPPVDGIYGDFNDDDGLSRTCERALRMGYGAKLLIHPRQIAVAKAIFSVDESALEQAARVVRGYEEGLRDGRGVVQVDGRVIDRPMVERARRLLQQQRRPV